MSIIYSLLGALFSCLAIKSFGAAFSGNGEDEHSLLGDDEVSELDDNFEEDSELENDDDWRDESEDEFSSDWYLDELTEKVK